MSNKHGLIIITLLSFTCLSHAELVYQVNGVNYAAGSTITAEPNSDVVIAIYNTTETPFCYDLGAVIVAGDATFGDPGTSTVYSENLPGSWSTANFGYWVDYDGLGHDGEIFLITYDYPAITPTLQGKQFDFTVHFTGPIATFAIADSSLYTATYGNPLTLVAPDAEPDPTPTPVPMAHGSILIYKISSHLRGYSYNASTTPNTIRPCSYPLNGYIIADVNTKTLYTNYPSAPDANSPTFIALSSGSFCIFSCSDPCVTAEFDLAKAGSAYYQKFSVLNSKGRPANKTLVMPTFDLCYTGNSKIFAFFDDGLTGNMALTDIGETAKASVTTAIVGNAEFDLGPTRKVSGSVTLTLDSIYTKAANKADMRVSKAVNMLKTDLQKKYSAQTLSAFASQ